MKKYALFLLLCLTILVALYLFVSSRSMLNSLNERNTHLEQKTEQLQDSLTRLNEQYQVANKYRLGKSGEAFYEEIGIKNPEKWIVQQLMEQQPEEGNHPLIKFHSSNGGFHFYEARVLNHRWLIASFTDGKFNGAALISYDITAQHTITFQKLDEVIFPQSYSVLE